MHSAAYLDGTIMLARIYLSAGRILSGACAPHILKLARLCDTKKNTYPFFSFRGVIQSGVLTIQLWVLCGHCVHARRVLIIALKKLEPNSRQTEIHIAWMDGQCELHYGERKLTLLYFQGSRCVFDDPLDMLPQRRADSQIAYVDDIINKSPGCSAYVDDIIND